MKSIYFLFFTVVALILQACDTSQNEVLYVIEGQFFNDCAQTQPAANKSGTFNVVYQKKDGRSIQVFSDSLGNLKFGYKTSRKNSLGVDGSDPNTVNLYGFIMNLPHAQNLNLGKVTIRPDITFYVRIVPQKTYTANDTLFLRNVTQLYVDTPIPGPFKDTVLGPFYIKNSPVNTYYKNGKFGYNSGVVAYLKMASTQTEKIIQSTQFMCNCEDKINVDLIVN